MESMPFIAVPYARNGGNLDLDLADETRRGIMKGYEGWRWSRTESLSSP